MVRSIIVVRLILTEIFISIRLLLGEVPSVVVIVVEIGRRSASIALGSGGAGVLVAVGSGILHLHVV